MTSTNNIINIDLKERSYPIFIGSGILSHDYIFDNHIQTEQVMVVSNKTVAPLWLDRIKPSFRNRDIRTVILPDGERHKTLDSVKIIFDHLIHNRFDRNCTIVALGGGVVGDITGFSAACYQRGVNFIQIPTTLLAQVDSSVGGKTGVNHPVAKNMIGAFHQPRCVVIDTDTLSTLPDREYFSGIAEIIKYALINDGEFFLWLEENMELLCRRDLSILSSTIRRSCKNKASIVEHDEKENNKRALLNLGHTFGHAIESSTGYGKVLHGEAVAIGLCMAADMSHRMGLLEKRDEKRILDLISRAGLPIKSSIFLDSRHLLDIMSTDKKVQNNSLRLVLLKGIGHSFVSSDFSQDLLESVLAA